MSPRHLTPFFAFVLMLSWFATESVPAQSMNIACRLAEGVSPAPDDVAFRNDGAALTNLTCTVTLIGRNRDQASKVHKETNWPTGKFLEFKFASKDTVNDIQIVKLHGKSSQGSLNFLWTVYGLAKGIAWNDVLVSLEKEIREKDAQVNRMVFAPVIPGRVDLVPSGNPLSDTYRVQRGPSLYAGSDTDKLSRLQAEIKSLRMQYDYLKQHLTAAGVEPQVMSKCSQCDGRGQVYGPHYEFGRKEDGELGQVFKTGGWHQCEKCKGKGAR